MASPLLFVMRDEARAYIAFCALMQRLHKSFSQKDQLTLITKMQHLHDLVVHLDPQLARFLREHNLANMYFTQRWLLLELKREFEFDDALTVFETQWATLPIRAPDLVATTQTESWSSKSSNGYLILTEEDYLGPNSLPDAPDNIPCYAVRDLSLINKLVGVQFELHPPAGSRPSLSKPPPNITFLPSEDQIINSISDESLLKDDSLHVSLAEEVFAGSYLLAVRT
ncbi:hypothetical protein Ciccas_001991 [Cichlidogyrus casuarinus]|uniref:Rab-GAP TBC domain-containing protein n=1 Tax=Cichlidogyrus casuarinus TaxID=1844966 RepID=A0ABD2QJ25_9PLAT